MAEQTLPMDPRLARRRIAWRVALALPLVIGPLWSGLLTPYLPRVFLSSWAGGILVVLVGVCAYTDVRWHRIFNWATYTAFLWGLTLNAAQDVSVWAGYPLERAALSDPSPWLHLGSIGLGRSLLSGIITFVLMFILYRISGGGAGDVKLGTAISVYLGLERSFSMLIYSYLAAGIYGLCLIIWHVGVWSSLVFLFRKVGSSLFPTRIGPPDDADKSLLMQRIPLGGFFAIGTLAVLAEDLSWFEGFTLGTPGDDPE